MLKLLTWNIAHRPRAWHCLLDCDADVALLQEAVPPPADIAGRFEVDAAPWQTAGTGAVRPWRTAVVKLSDRVGVQWLTPKSIDSAGPDDLAVSLPGTLAAAEVTPGGGEPIMVASLYGAWERPHRTTASDWIYADASVHRLFSDLTSLIGRQGGHRILAAGDLNILHGYGEAGSPYWASRYATVFSRADALGLSFVGPQAPHGRRAEPWPDELPPDSGNVPTFHTSQQSPSAATRQLDFVFASLDLRHRVRVRAVNQPMDWGPSDHCRVEVEVV